MRRHLTWKIAAAVWIGVAAFCCEAIGFENQYLTHVKVEHAFMDLAGRPGAVISWRMRIEGTVDMIIADMDGLVVRHLHRKTPTSAGTHTATWDGRDDEGQPVPDGAYFPMIRLTHPRKGTEFYNPTNVRWGGMLPVQDLAYDAGAQQITYRLSQPALCLIRVGEGEGGPSYGTLLSWAPREAGDHAEPWDGKDIQGVATVYDREKFKFVFDAIALPPNALLVTGSHRPKKKPDPQQERTAVQPPTGNDIFIHSLHPRHVCQDPEVAIELLSGASQGKGGAAIFGGQVRISVTASDSDRARSMERMQSEIYLFVDGVFQSEVKAPTLPAEVTFNTKGLARGPHNLTINLRNVEDHVGSMTIPFVKKQR